MRAFLRKIFLLVTCVLVLIAVLLSIGRLSALIPKTIQAIANVELEDRDVVIYGLKTHWRRTNPIIEIAKIDFPNGTVHGLSVEIAVFESLIRNQFVARRLSIEEIEVEIALEAQPQDFDFLKLIAQIQSNFEWIRHSDELQVAAKATLRRQQTQQSWLINVHAVNQGGAHRYRAKLTNASPGGGSAEFVADAVDTLLDLRTGNYEMTLTASDMPVDLTLLTGKAGMPSWLLNGRAEWTQVDHQVQGHITLNLASPDKQTLKAEVNALLQQNNDEPARFRLQSPTLSTPDHEIELNDWLLAIDEDVLIGTTKAVRVHALMPVLIEAVSNNKKQAEWLTAMAMRGTLERLEFAFDPRGLYWFAQAKDMAADSHLRLPESQVANSEMYGNLRQIAIKVRNSQSRLFLNSYFNKPWRFASATGLFIFDIQNNSVGLYAHDMEFHIAETEGQPNPNRQLDVVSLLERAENTIQLSELIHEPVTASVRGGMRHMFGEPPHYRSAIFIESTNTLLPAHQLAEFVPTAIIEDLTRWRDEYLETASFFGTNVVYLTYRDAVLGQNHRDFHIGGRFTNGTINYQSDWPALTNVGGKWHANNEQLVITTDRATVQNTELRNGFALFPFDRNDTFKIRFGTTAKVQDTLDFIQASEINSWLPVFAPSWAGNGLVTMDAELNFPYEDIENDEPVDAIPGDHQITFQFHDATLLMRDLRIELNELNGKATWHSPYQLEAQLDRGEFFDETMSGAISTTKVDDKAVIEFRLDSHVDFNTVLHIAGFDNLDIGSGSTDFNAQLNVYPGTDEATMLFATTDLDGVQLNLPAPISKLADDIEPTSMQMSFYDEHTEFTLQSRDLNGWLQLEGDPATIEAGTVALGRSTSIPPRIDNRLHLAGMLDEWEFEFDESGELDVPITLTNMQISRLIALDHPFLNATITGSYDNEREFAVNIESDAFDGSITKTAEDPYTIIEASTLIWTLDAQDETTDPLDLEVMDWIIPTKVAINELQLQSDDEPIEAWGTWAFTITPMQDAIEISDLVIDTNGLQIAAVEPLKWMRETNETTFNGVFAGENLGSILEAWDYDASVESELFDAKANVRWPGSPLAWDIERMSGQLQANADRGRFLDLDQGGDVLRLVSLLNFSKILNRLTLDFKDVTQSGLHFDEVALDVTLDQGLISFNSPMRIDGPSARLRIGGEVDTISGTLDSNLRVTIPLHKGFQTWAAYLAATNPPAIATVLLGTLLLSEPLKALLTAHYNITGNLDDPVLTRVDLTASRSSQASTN